MTEKREAEDWQRFEHFWPKVKPFDLSAWRFDLVAARMVRGAVVGAVVVRK